MRLFAVRLIKDKQAVGFFWAPDPITLWWMIDSVCDPGDCEYHRINDRAAITWQSKVSATLGAGSEFDDETQENPALTELRNKVTFDYALEDYVIGEIETDGKKYRMRPSLAVEFTKYSKGKTRISVQKSAESCGRPGQANKSTSSIS